MPYVGNAVKKARSAYAAQIIFAVEVVVLWMYVSGNIGITSKNAPMILCCDVFFCIGPHGGPGCDEDIRRYLAECGLETLGEN